ncbi:monooxygenase family protein [Paenibacillus shunpengii]|uniref:Monooxygenase family protein n=1 Tax=Paenibacillus shunpengii TaxID=2054424 RepID=A0ABW5SK18_9BACL
MAQPNLEVILRYRKRTSVSSLKNPIALAVGVSKYWKTYDQLEKYARGGTHLVEWKKFNQSVGTNGTVGIYHETYMIQPGQYECIYGNMPKFGLAKAGTHMPAVGRMETSRRRMGGDNDPAVPTPKNRQ